MTEASASALNNIAVLCEARNVLLQGLIVEEVFGMDPDTAQVLEDAFTFAIRKCAEKLDLRPTLHYRE